jgi:6-pyruvoyltetrahydropterin/6-carboxytetrahydropterin synthase
VRKKGFPLPSLGQRSIFPEILSGSLTLGLPFSIKVYKQYFNFASSHFMIFENGTREPLHGHNYRVQVKGEAPNLAGDMVFDFLDIKPIVREVCDSLDHKLLIPKDNDKLKIHTENKNYVITTPDESVFSIPMSDVLLLPILNTSAERIAVYICDEIRKLVKVRFGFAFNSLEIEVEETPGQSAVYVHREEL